MNVALLTNIPAPYRERIHEIISKKINGNYKVFYCAEMEANREWKVKYGNYEKYVFKLNNKNGIHNDIGIFRKLIDYKPDIVIIMGFYPTMIYAFLWSILWRKKLIVFTDGTMKSENNLSFIHKIIRKIVFIKASCFIGPAKGSLKLYENYGVDEKKFFRTYLCVDNEKFSKIPLHEKKFDIMFSGQIIERKLPFFFLEVAKELKKELGKCRVLILGNGELKNLLIKKLQKEGIDFVYPGFIDQSELPKYYSQAKFLLFPSLNDPWGVVANEAMASGVPVITCENTGVANDLVINNENGFVMDLDVKKWATIITTTLSNPKEYERLSENAFQYVQRFNFESAAQGIIEAINFTKQIDKN